MFQRARAQGRCLAPPVAHIAEHFTVARRKLLTVHTKWIGRCDRRGVKLQHGSVLFISAVRALRRLDGAGDAGGRQRAGGASLLGMGSDGSAAAAMGGGVVRGGASPSRIESARTGPWRLSGRPS